MAATRAIPTALKETDSSGTPVLERLQYRTVQLRKPQDAAPLAHPKDNPASLLPPVALFPSHADAFSDVEDVDVLDSRSGLETEGQQMLAELQKRLEDDKLASAQAIAMAREQGRREGRQAVEQQVSVEQRRLQTQILQALEEFRLERQNYFHHVEGEVVRLALGIAARVLQREAHLDPLLLAGAVRVALDKLGDSSSVVLRVPPREVGQWKELFRATGSLRIQPGVLEDPSLSPGECVLATELGTIELGVRAQLQEIEKGFFDLLDRRPAGTGGTAAAAGQSSV